MMPRTTSPQTLLRLEDVHAAYVNKEILRGVSLNIHRGEMVAVLGGNGSGKSTLLKTIAGLLLPSNGQIEFKGRDITQVSVHTRQRHGMGYLLQGGRVFANLSIEENFEISVKHHRDHRNGNVTRLGSIFPILRERKKIRAGLLSGGQRQMLAIEMVLAQEPELALLDEPTGALCPDLARSILRQVAQDASARSSSVLLVEQNQEEAKAVSNRCLVLAEGIVQEHKHAIL